MARFLTILLIATVMIAHGSSVAAKVCLHQTAHEHMLARSSSDRAIAAAPLAEEAAAAMDAKKSPQSGGNVIHWPVDMLPAVLPALPLLLGEMPQPRPGNQPALPSASVEPPTKPPSA